MQKTLYILIFVLLLSSKAFAQKTVTATMRISATIVSGVTLNHVEAMDVDFNTGIQTHSNLEFTTPKYLDTDVEVTETVVLENEFGDQLELTSESEHRVKDGKHRVTLTATVDPAINQNEPGYYQGSLTTTINYL